MRTDSKLRLIASKLWNYRHPIAIPTPGLYEIDLRGIFRSPIQEPNLKDGWRVATVGEVIEASKILYTSRRIIPLRFIHIGELVDGIRIIGYGHSERTEKCDYWITYFDGEGYPFADVVGKEILWPSKSINLWHNHFITTSLRSVLIREGENQ